MPQNEETLIADVLNVAHLAKLPAAVNPEEFIWIEGIAKFKLMDGNTSYGIVKRTPDLSYTVSYINGTTAQIRSLEEVYPFNNIDKRHIKKFANEDDRDGRVNYLKSLNLPYANKIDFENATISELNKEIVKAAVYQQLNAMEE